MHQRRREVRRDGRGILQLIGIERRRRRAEGRRSWARGRVRTGSRRGCKRDARRGRQRQRWGGSSGMARRCRDRLGRHRAHPRRHGAHRRVHRLRKSRHRAADRRRRRSQRRRVAGGVGRGNWSRWLRRQPCCSAILRLLLLLLLCVHRRMQNGRWRLWSRRWNHRGAGGSLRRPDRKGSA